MLRITIALLNIIFLISAERLEAKEDKNKTKINKLYHWLKKNKDANSGLPYSHVGDKTFHHWVITYDCAVTALAYTALKKEEEARNILDYFIDHQEHWRLGGLIEVFNADTKQGIDWSIRTGANTWMGLAYYHGYKNFKNPDYLKYAELIGDNHLKLQNKEKGDLNYGGIRLGPRGDPNYPLDQRIGFSLHKPKYWDVYSTEIAIDNYALFNHLYQETKKEKYKEGRELLYHWIKTIAYNPKESRLNRGAIDSIDTTVATDIHSWAISSIGPERLNQIENSLADKMISFINKHCLQKVEYKKLDGETVKVIGYDFIENKERIKKKREALVSPEWTFQSINALSRLIKYKKEKGLDHGLYTKQRQELIDSMLKLADSTDTTMTYPYATLSQALIGHEHKTPKLSNHSTIGVSYGILALLDFDPLSCE